MKKQKRQSRKFSGMGYREVQRSNSIRRSKLLETEQNWLRENSYKNIGWDNIIRLYQKINELEFKPDGKPTLEELFLNAERIGQKYQTHDEKEAFSQQMATTVNEISNQIDEQFPENEVEVIDFSQNSHSHSKTRPSRKKCYSTKSGRL